MGSDYTMVMGPPMLSYSAALEALAMGVLGPRSKDFAPL